MVQVASKGKKTHSARERFSFHIINMAEVKNNENNKAFSPSF